MWYDLREKREESKELTWKLINNSLTASRTSSLQRQEEKAIQTF